MKKRVKWPGMGERGVWERMDGVVCGMLQSLKGRVEDRLRKMSKIVFEYACVTFGVKECVARGEKETRLSMRQREIEDRRTELRSLNRRWKKTVEGERNGFEV